MLLLVRPIAHLAHGNTSRAYRRDALHATANICGTEAVWNVRIVKLITDLSLTACYAMCLLHKVPSSVMGKHLKIYWHTLLPI